MRLLAAGAHCATFGCLSIWRANQGRSKRPCVAPRWSRIKGLGEVTEIMRLYRTGGEAFWIRETRVQSSAKGDERVYRGCDCLAHQFQ